MVGQKKCFFDTTAYFFKTHILHFICPTTAYFFKTEPNFKKTFFLPYQRLLYGKYGVFRKLFVNLVGLELNLVRSMSTWVTKNTWVTKCEMSYLVDTGGPPPLSLVVGMRVALGSGKRLENHTF